MSVLAWAEYVKRLDRATLEDIETAMEQLDRAVDADAGPSEPNMLVLLFRGVLAVYEQDRIGRMIDDLAAGLEGP